MDDIERAISVALLSKAAKVIAEQQAFINALMGELTLAGQANDELLSIAEEIGSDLESADEEFDILEDFVSSITGVPVDNVFEYFVLPHMSKPTMLDIETREFDDGGPYNGMFFASYWDEGCDFPIIIPEGIYGEVIVEFVNPDVFGEIENQLPDYNDWNWLQAAILEKAEDSRFDQVQANFWLGFVTELRD